VHVDMLLLWGAIPSNPQPEHKLERAQLTLHVAHVVVDAPLHVKQLGWHFVQIVAPELLEVNMGQGMHTPLAL
jgi:hypothetical protein